MSYLTFGEVRKIVAPYVGQGGRDPSSPETAIFARSVMELLLYEGHEGGVRNLSILAYRGFITLPPEVEVPLKVRIGHRRAEVWNKWCTLHNVSESFDECFPANQVIAEDGSLTPLAYELPPGGSVVGLEATCEEAPEAAIIIQGKDTTGKPVFSFHNGEQVPGEKITLKKNVLKYGMVIFGEVTGILKCQTNGYVECFAVDPILERKQFLASWGPNDTRPLYRRFKILNSLGSELVHLSILCRVKLRDTYHDNELTIFSSVLSLTMAAQRIQSEAKNDLPTANYKREAVRDLLNNEAGYKRGVGGPIAVSGPMTGSSIRNIIR